MASAAGDPLIAPLTAPTGDGEAILSEEAARRMALAPGDMIRLAVQRRLGDQVEGKSLSLRITGIAPLAAFGREGAFVSVDLLAALEDYRDGRPVPRLGWAGPNTLTLRAFAGFRAVAATIEDVAPTAARLEALGYTVDHQGGRDRDGAAPRPQSFGDFPDHRRHRRQRLRPQPWGQPESGHVARKRGELSLLRFMGLSTGGMAAFPLFQGGAIALGGAILAVLVFLGAAGPRSIYSFSAGLPGGGDLCRLDGGQIGAVVGLALAVAFGASALAGFRAAGVEPGEGVRHG